MSQLKGDFQMLGLIFESQTLLRLASRLLIYTTVAPVVSFYSARLPPPNTTTICIWLFISSARLLLPSASLIQQSKFDTSKLILVERNYHLQTCTVIDYGRCWLIECSPSLLVSRFFCQRVGEKTLGIGLRVVTLWG